MRGLLCETSEKSLAFAKFSDRAPLTKLYPSLKNLPSDVRESKTFLNSGFRIPGTAFQSLTVVLGFRIPMVCRIPDSAIQIPLHVVKSFTVTLHPLFTSESVELKAKSGSVVELGWQGLNKTSLVLSFDLTNVILPLVSHWEVLTRILICCGFCFWSARLTLPH